MSKFNSNFSFNPRDIELIELGLRTLRKHYDVIDDLSKGVSPNSDSIRAKDQMLKQINEVLGKIENKKITFSQVHPHKGVPLG